MNPHITRCLAEQQQCLDQLESVGPHDAGARYTGARLGLSDWLLEECFVRCDEEETLP